MYTDSDMVYTVGTLSNMKLSICFWVWHVNVFVPPDQNLTSGSNFKRNPHVMNRSSYKDDSRLKLFRRYAIMAWPMTCHAQKPILRFFLIHHNVQYISAF